MEKKSERHLPHLSHPPHFSSLPPWLSKPLQCSQLPSELTTVTGWTVTLLCLESMSCWLLTVSSSDEGCNPALASKALANAPLVSGLTARGAHVPTVLWSHYMTVAVHSLPLLPASPRPVVSAWKAFGFPPGELF